ncbi:hypothetical protein L226DRAFT_568077 [Lentinus tigrinus ALCF2SS1-7]|uniref:uncharacterized protein n=1 Tax=Lentinus tigrinus ALCF2SS1-7 TaxID=1328758 RepID=UPI0011663490|nr:hypothetical protein L226DRAFT_568077 [Lentinus tigrinus ALCF2SS1-7]
MTARRLSAEDKEVFSSIFRLDGGVRRDIDWVEFLKAMGNIGFTIGPCGKTAGSGRGFIAPEEFGDRRMRLDNPHGSRDRTLRSADQNKLAKRLNAHFGLENHVVNMLAMEVVDEEEE